MISSLAASLWVLLAKHGVSSLVLVWGRPPRTWAFIAVS